jgi:hypothetical protein
VYCKSNPAIVLYSKRISDKAVCVCSKSSSDQSYAFKLNRPNPHMLTGAIVGGPKDDDSFTDFRDEFHYTEVALDYNVGLTMALASLAAAPPSFWATDCSQYVPNYPWQNASAGAKPALA